MRTSFHFSRVKLFQLCTHLICLGAFVVFIVVDRGSVPIIVLACCSLVIAGVLIAEAWLVGHKKKHTVLK